MPESRPTVLVVDDEPTFQETIARFLRGVRRLAAYTAVDAFAALERHNVDVILLDLHIPDMNGLEVLSRIRAERDDVAVLVVTSHADLPHAVDAVKRGAFDFLPKSLESYEAISAHIGRALEDRQRRRFAELARADDAYRDAFAVLETTRSPRLAEALAVLRPMASTQLTVLLEGESGSGKELLARYVHYRSPRAARPFVPVSMAAIPPTLLESTLFGHEKGAFTGADRQRLGKFQLAEGGTLFLDEIGELDLTAQAKLLRALQEREVERLGAAEPSAIDVRVLAATNRRLEDEVAAGRFREDLWYRLNVVRIQVPALRQRREDIPELCTLLAAKHARLAGSEPPRFAPEALAALADYVWPGNVRELENFVMRMVALHAGHSVRLADVPVEYLLEHLGSLALDRVAQDAGDGAGKLYDLAREHFERYLVRHMVERCHGNKSEAARRLGVAYSTLKKKCEPDE